MDSAAWRPPTHTSRSVPPGPQGNFVAAALPCLVLGNVDKDMAQADSRDGASRLEAEATMQAAQHKKLEHHGDAENVA